MEMSHRIGPLNSALSSMRVKASTCLSCPFPECASYSLLRPLFVTKVVSVTAWVGKDKYTSHALSFNADSVELVRDESGTVCGTSEMGVTTFPFFARLTFFCSVGMVETHVYNLSKMESCIRCGFPQ